MCIAFCKQADSEAATGGGAVALVVVVLSGHESRPDGDVARVRPDELEQPGELGRWVLAVRIHPTAECVAAFCGFAIAGCDPGPQAAILAERDDGGTTAGGHGCGRVGRAVVDHEHIAAGQHGGELCEDGGEVRLFVPGGNEDDGVGGRAHRPRLDDRSGTAALGFGRPSLCRSLADRDPPAVETAGVVLASRRQTPSRKETAVPGIDAKSNAIYDLVEEGSGVEQLATGIHVHRGPDLASRRSRCSTSPTCRRTSAGR